MYIKIKLGYPNIWIKSTDSSRLSDILTSTLPAREFYTIDPYFGFSKYDNSTWKQVLVTNPLYPEQSPDQYTVTFDPQISLSYLLALKQSNVSFLVNVIGDPNSVVPNYSSLLHHFSNQYRNSFWKDDLSLLPLQFIFISNQDPPEHYAHFFNLLEDSYPNPQELHSIVSHINASAHDSLIAQDHIKDAVASGLGLTESHFIDLCLTSVISKSKIDPKFIYDQKMATVKKNGILEIIRPSITFDDIGGLNNIKDIIRRTSFLWNDKEKARAYGITPIRRMLMVGVPGTGKSAICQATAAELNLDLARTGVSQVMNSFIGQSEANMRAVFNQIKAMSPLCVWIDEFGRDLSGGSSSSHVDGGTTDRVHGEFLTGLQELPEESFLLCAANSLDSLRPEMLRADRFDKIMFVGLPAHEERKHIFSIHLSKIDTDHRYDYDALAAASKYFTGAEIVSLIKETKFYVTSEDFRPISTQDILTRIPLSKNIIWLKHRDMVLSMYSYAMQQWDWASTDQYEDAKLLLKQSSNTTTKSPSIAWK